MGPKEETKFTRDEVAIHISSFVYRLRMAQALRAEATLYEPARTTLYVDTLIRDMLEAAEHARTYLEATPEGCFTWNTQEAGLGPSGPSAHDER